MQRWTFGAGHVALRSEPYRGADTDVSLFQGLALASQEWSRAGSSRRRLGMSAGALLIGAWLAAALIVAALRDREDASGLEIVMLELPLPEPELIPEPAPIAKPAPPRAPIAKPAPRPAPVARPMFPAAPAPLAPAPRPAAPQPRDHVARPTLPKPALKIDAVAAPAEATPRASEPPRLALRPVVAPPARPRPAPSFDLGAPAAPGLANEPTPRVASARATTAAPVSARPSARSVARPPASLALPALSASAPVRDPGAEPTPSRVAARDPAPTSSGSRSNDPKLRGVALGSLASCMSDKQEDDLKQQLVALVGEPAECVSSAGRYRFVETRNLNAFSLWVERAPARPAGDRCVELTHALACVRQHGGREWRRG
jgi:hypothetical protein